MKTVRGLLRKMFCASCGAKPTEDEVEEMFKNFGAKVKPGDHLIRLCRTCLHKGVRPEDVRIKVVGPS